MFYLTQFDHLPTSWEPQKRADVSTKDSEISISLVGDRWISGFQVTKLDDFIQEVNKMVEIAQRGGNKYLQQIFTSPCFGSTKKMAYSVVMIKGSDGSESDLWFALVLYLLCLGCWREEVALAPSAVHPNQRCWGGWIMVWGGAIGIPDVPCASFLRANPPIQHFTRELPWSHHQFDVNLF